MDGHYFDLLHQYIQDYLRLFTHWLQILAPNFKSKSSNIHFSNMGYNEYPGILREPLSNYENTFEYLQGLNDHSVQTALSRAIKSANAVSSILSINDGGFLPWVVDQVEDTMKDKALATGWKIKNIIFSNYDEEKEKPAEAFVKDIGKQLFWAGLTFLKGAVIGASTGMPQFLRPRHFHLVPRSSVETFKSIQAHSLLSTTRHSIYASNHPGCLRPSLLPKTRRIRTDEERSMAHRQANG